MIITYYDLVPTSQSGWKLGCKESQCNHPHFLDCCIHNSSDEPLQAELGFLCRQDVLLKEHSGWRLGCNKLKTQRPVWLEAGMQTR